MSEFLALALRLRHIKRWSLMHCVEQESVMEHSYQVALLAMMAGIRAKELGQTVSPEKMMAAALLHDLSEVICSDVVTPVKNATPELAREFHALERHAEQRILSTLPATIHSHVIDLASLNELETKLLKGCDLLSAFIKCKIEVGHGNGQEFQHALDSLTERLEQTMDELPVIADLHQWFSGSLESSVDVLFRSLNKEQ